jgi:hypothetical protein
MVSRDLQAGLRVDDSQLNSFHCLLLRRLFVLAVVVGEIVSNVNSHNTNEMSKLTASALIYEPALVLALG